MPPLHLPSRRRKPAPRCSQSARSQKSTSSAMTCHDTPLQHLESVWVCPNPRFPNGPLKWPVFSSPIQVNGPPKRTLPSHATTSQSNIEVHAELIRMRPDADRIDLVFTLVFDPVVNHIGGKNVAL